MSEPVVIASWRRNAREGARLALQEYRGCRTVDLRVTVPLAAHSPQQIPTKSGCSLPIVLLPALREAVEEALSTARSMGWLE